MWKGGSFAALDVVVRVKMELLLQESVYLRGDWDWIVARFLFLKGYLIQLVKKCVMRGMFDFVSNFQE